MSKSQSVKDALADAETLRSNVPHPSTAYLMLWLANGARGGRMKKAIRRSIWQAGRLATDMAHAAFRAVPGLRG